MQQPVLRTERLLLRPFTLSDASRVQQLAGDKRIADTTATVPHPYENGMAESWIAMHQPAWEAGTAVVYAVTLNTTGELLGTVSVRKLDTGFGDLGYWIGVPYWGKGYCTEACRRLLEFLPEALELKGLKALHLRDNPASGRVMEKCGFLFREEITIQMNGQDRQLKCYELPAVAA